MVGKLLYSRVLQNRLATKHQASSNGSVDTTLVAQPKPPQQYYSSQQDGYPPSEPRSPYDAPYSSSNDRYDKSEGNKVRRGPGRRIAKEKRVHSIDPALMQKYSSLPESMQEKVNATIEICYQQHMANLYKNPGKQSRDDSHYDQDVEIDANEAMGTSGVE